MAGGRDSTERFGDRAIDYASFRPGRSDPVSTTAPIA